VYGFFLEGEIHEPLWHATIPTKPEKNRKFPESDFRTAHPAAAVHKIGVCANFTDFDRAVPITYDKPKSL